jgi:hypothetical protein
MKVRTVGAELFRADGRTDSYDEANSDVSQLCERAYKRSNANDQYASTWLLAVHKQWCIKMCGTADVLIIGDPGWVCKRCGQPWRRYS